MRAFDRSKFGGAISAGKKGKKFSEKHKQALRAAFDTDECKAKKTKTRTGMKFSDEAKAAMRLAAKTRKPQSAESNLKRSDSMKGKMPVNLEALRLQKIGIPRPHQACIKMSIALKGKSQTTLHVLKRQLTKSGGNGAVYDDIETRSEPT